MYAAYAAMMLMLFRHYADDVSPAAHAAAASALMPRRLL